MTESQIEIYTRWHQDGDVRRIAVLKRLSGNDWQYVVRLDGNFYDAAESLAKAREIVEDIISTLRLRDTNPYFS